MSTEHNEKYIFEAEWYDKIASILKKFYLYYYPFDNTVELVCLRQFYFVNIFAIRISIIFPNFQFDIKARKTFLRRTKCEGIQAKDFYVGATVTIFSRNIRITDYADCATRTKLQTKMQKYTITSGTVFSDFVNVLQYIFFCYLGHLQQ